MSIIVESVSKNFGEFQALDRVSLKVKDGGLVALLGPSGSGKSTLLRAISGLETVDSGKILINGQDTTNLDVRQRNIGFVFQHYALFKHLTVRQNVAFGLDIRKRPRGEVQQRVGDLLELVQLTGLGDRYPSQLSGGQRQRVALARALAVQPQVLLLDEPFGALDAKVRKELRAWLRRLHDEVHVTSVFVTHDQEEAMEVADEVVIMNHGRIEQVGTPEEIYDNPATAFVMSFIGPVNVLPGHLGLFKTLTTQETRNSNVFLRPQDIEILEQPHPEAIPAVVARIIHLGWEVQAELALPDEHNLTAHVSREQFKSLDLRVNQNVFIKSKFAKAFPEVEVFR
ncbi:sulfate ABC transporter ATP-binding protein [Synechococcales cyanobacterium C]|uniref:ABC-type quaternary amine transporter n=1 Tax=Petrachloros mirabilis ULC683 TaxID=2781853 RepID=A0A8K1ZWP2_9CYAN|nr:TOBE-like domain-containing protein [Petrachloros mirabilis]NCJ05267.1 sulfate ABC transporter ATP-binding protein [Petrachloros mirabilis ULC683]